MSVVRREGPIQNEMIEDTLLVDRADPDEVIQSVDKDDTEGEDWEWVEEEVWNGVKDNCYFEYDLQSRRAGTK